MKITIEESVVRITTTAGQTVVLDSGEKPEPTAIERCPLCGLHDRGTACTFSPKQ